MINDVLIVTFTGYIQNIRLISARLASKTEKSYYIIRTVTSDRNQKPAKEQIRQIEELHERKTLTMKRKIITCFLSLLILAGVTGAAQVTPEPQPEPETPDITVIPAPATSKASASSIRIAWTSSEDDMVNTYYVMRRKTKNNEGTGKWKKIAKVKSDGIKGGPDNTYTDQLGSTQPVQYEYKICILSADKAMDTREASFAEETDLHTSLGTNVKVCIDPGHFKTVNNNYDLTGADGKFPYSEAKFTLKTGKALQAELKDSYGIDSYMTRTAKKISLTYNGRKYVNETLDQSNIAVRGYMAKANDCDLFISLHTNSTSRTTQPWSQPDSINKVYVFVNRIAHNSERDMEIANAIGLSLTEYNQDAGIQTTGFTTRTPGNASSFSDQNNDASDINGTIVFRRGSSGSDYYGVLRGCSADGIPGILVEHAFHATKIMRKQAKGSADLYENWAACDAYGIACGFGFSD